jgi:hypothetical protein
LHEHSAYRCGTQCFHLGSEHRTARSVSQEAGWLAIMLAIMLATVLGVVLPMVVAVLLGFVAVWHHDCGSKWHHDCGSKDAPILNRMVLVYALPLALFP